MSGEAWGAFPKLIDQDLAVASYPGLTGKSFSVAVLDTGIDYRHPALGGGFGPGYKVIAGWDSVDNDPDPTDPTGHGTPVASVIAANSFVYGGYKYQGVAPEANLIALRTDDGSDYPNGPRIEAALQWVIAHRVQYNIVAINISTGEGHYSSEVSQGQFTDELKTLYDLGVFICASSGNDGVQKPYGVEYPAADPSVYAIGSVNSSDVISTFTERGANMDLLAPGENVPVVTFRDTDHAYISWYGSGTSFSAPYAAGAAVLLKQIDPTITPAQIMKILQDSGVSNYDGDNEVPPFTKLTFKRLDLDNAIAMTYALRDDGYEENDTRATATPLDFVNDRAGLSGLKMLAGDKDFYSFALENESVVGIDLSIDPSQLAGYDLRDANGNVIKTLTGSDSIRLEPGTYYVRLACGVTVGGTYSINLWRVQDDACENNDTRATASALPFDGTSASIDGMRLLAGDDDYYKFTLASAGQVDLLTKGTLATPRVYLLNSAGNTVADYTGGCSQRLAAGTYYLCVPAGADDLPGSYSLSMSVQYDDNYEANDSLASATPLTLTDGRAALSQLRLLPDNPDYYSVVLPTMSDLSASASYSGGTLGMKVYSGSGADLGWASSAMRLAAGTYYLRLDSTTGVSGDYSLDLSVKPVGVGANATVSRIAYDKLGNLHLAYYDSSTNDLKYAVKSAAGVWSDVQVVDSGYGAGQQLSLAVDKYNRPGIAYYDATNGDLKYAHWNGTQWMISTVDSVGITGLAPSIAYNASSGMPAFTYYDKSNGDLRFATYTTKWVYKTLDASAGASASSSIAWNASKKAFCVAYARGTDGMYRYGIQNPSTGAWTFTNIDDTATGGGYISLALDASYRPAFSYYDSSKADLKFARYNGSAWQVATVAATGYQGTFSTLRFTSDGKADILFYNKSASAIYAATGNIGAWSTKLIRSAAGAQLVGAINPLTSKETYEWLSSASPILAFATR